MSVPSNLIPTRITQLPIAPVASEDSLMLIVYEGATYQIRVGDLLSVAGVPVSRQVIAGTGLTGGGQLNENVTLSIAPGGVGPVQLVNSGVTPGVYGSSLSVPVVEVDDKGRVTSITTEPIGVSGFVPTTRQVIAGTGLSGGGALNADVTLSVDLSDAVPLPPDGGGSAGVAVQPARADHEHPALDLADDDQVTGVLKLDNGGTARSLVPNPGAIVWSGADGLYIGPAGAAGQVLVSGGDGEPGWGSALVISNQDANTFYAGPTEGAAAPTAFRAMVNADLPDSGVTASVYGDSTNVPVVTVNAKGVVTHVTTVPVSVSSVNWSIVTGTPTTLGGYGITDAVPVTRSISPGTGLSGGGDLSANRVLSIASTGVTAGDYGAAGKTLTLTVNSQGQLTAVSETAITVTSAQVSGLGTSAALDAGVPNGVATLDATGKVPTAQLPAFTPPVLSVNGQTGAVVLAASDVGAPTTTGTGASGTWAISVSGNAATVTNGVYTTGSYANPSWITSLAGSKITGQLTNGISGGTF